MMFGCFTHGIIFRYFTGYSPVLHEVRNICMGADRNGGKNQIPFHGWDYDYIMFIDSDMVFNFDHFKKLLAHNKDIVVGWYSLQLNNLNGGRMSSVLDWCREGAFPDQFYSIMELYDSGTSLRKVDSTGLGFALIRKGVFEKIGYPWFYPTPEEIEAINKKAKQDIVFTIREDIAWCEKVTTEKFDIWLDPSCRVGHEKRMIL